MIKALKLFSLFPSLFDLIYSYLKKIIFSTALITQNF